MNPAVELQAIALFLNVVEDGFVGFAAFAATFHLTPWSGLNNWGTNTDCEMVQVLANCNVRSESCGRFLDVIILTGSHRRKEHLRDRKSLIYLTIEIVALKRSYEISESYASTDRSSIFEPLAELNQASRVRSG
jgi:hypothetical protein